MMSPQEFKALLKKGKHSIEYCSHCHYPMIVCGYCGNNTCNGGSGDSCPDSCGEAYKLFDANRYPWWMVLRAKCYHRLYIVFRKFQVRWEDWKYAREQK